MREEEKIEKYLFDADQQYKKMMRAYFKCQSYLSKLDNLNLDDKQLEDKQLIIDRLNKSIEKRIRKRE